MKLSRQKTTARLGMNYIERIALEAGCKMIPVPEDLDTGIDGFVEFAENEETIGKLIAFQAKRGSSFFESGRPRCQVDQKHMQYWRDYSIPVLLIIVNEDNSEAYWMDIQRYAREHPDVIESGPYVVYPPESQQFDIDTLISEIMLQYARPVSFNVAVSQLIDTSPEQRISGLGILYLYHLEHRSIFLLAAALCFETEPEVIRAMCDFYSRYIIHPEVSFQVTREKKNYAESLLKQMGDKQLYAILDSFESEDYSLDATTEIFGLAPEEIWVRHDVISRGTVQQGIAEVVRVMANGHRLLSVIENRRFETGIRRAATALFGYLGYTCPVEILVNIRSEESDEVIAALLTWLIFWIERE